MNGVQFLLSVIALGVLFSSPDALGYRIFGSNAIEIIAWFFAYFIFVFAFAAFEEWQAERRWKRQKEHCEAIRANTPKSYWL